MDFDKILSAAGDALAIAAPTAARMLFGPLAGTVVEGLERVLGVEPGTAAKDPEAFGRQLRDLSPEQAIELRKLDVQLETARMAHEREQLALEVANVQGARDRQVRLGDHFPEELTRRLYWLVVLLCSMQFAVIVLGMVTKTQVMPELLRALDGLTGLVIGLYAAANNFWFGSTGGSRTKDQTIAALSRPAAIALLILVGATVSSCAPVATVPAAAAAAEPAPTALRRLKRQVALAVAVAELDLLPDPSVVRIMLGHYADMRRQALDCWHPQGPQDGAEPPG